MTERAGNNTPTPRPLRFAAALAAGACLLATSWVRAGDADQILSDSAMNGWQVFVQKECLACHAVWGLGGTVGPDLGRTGHRHLSAGKLAGSMWNHVPKVYSHAQENNLDYPVITMEEMGDLFNFLFFVRYLDEPGDPAAGKRLLREKGCASCHETQGYMQQGAPDLKRWAGYANPVVWAQKMWEHAPKMQKAMKDAGKQWPELKDTDLLDIIAYLRDVGGTESKVYLRPGSSKEGARLFTERKCRTCHYSGGQGGDLAGLDLPESLVALATRMWNHSPEMTRAMQARDQERASFTAQEMADIITYVISLQYQEFGGDAPRGRAVFENKGCTNCHAMEQPEDAVAPDLKTLSASARPVPLAHAMWGHGVSMMDEMALRGIGWPVFQPDEMVDLVTYLRSIAPVVEPPPGPPPSVRRVPLPVVEAHLLPPIDPDASCVSNVCHPGVVAAREVHAPAAQGECDTCHVLLDAEKHKFKMFSNDSEQCYQCHDEPPELAEAGASVAVGVCIACHDPHGAENLFGPGFTGKESCFADMIAMTSAMEVLVGAGNAVLVETIVSPGAMELPPIPSLPAIPGPQTAVDVSQGCVTNECHPKVVLAQFVHGPTAQEQCDACHEPVPGDAHLFVQPYPEPDLCFECHDRPIEKTEYQHGPVALGACTVCHDPHGAPYEFMLPEKGVALCYMCHTEMEEHVLDAREQHQVIEEEGCLACHDAHEESYEFQLKADMPDLCVECHEPIGKIIEASSVAHQPVYSDKKCVNCHNPHGSDVPKILLDVEMDLCLSCHDEPMDTPNGPIIDMKTWIADNPERHGPIRDGFCTGCHQPHGSENFRILQFAFPKAFYSPFSNEVYALCFECHEETIVLDERTTTLTDFRNGEVNLHFLHVNQEKGRTCRACHEMHAGTKPKRIKDFVPFGNWEYPVNFKINETGGSCMPGCHVERAYDRNEEIIQD